MERGPSDEQLQLVKDHGAGSLERALATVLLAKRNGRIDELRNLLEEHERP